ncbi:MAG: hypothetical protein LBQ52_01485 [Helicobacteraceae bacterium]|jgi:hypothetical protein|nr:hypothetical protein [Helicobacteraceae bacterium]
MEALPILGVVTRSFRQGKINSCVEYSMCWKLIYYEKKIAIAAPLGDYSVYKKVNVVEGGDYSFQIDKIYLQNNAYYNITHNQCACDFFASKYRSLQEEFIAFVLTRMQIESLEAFILTKWIDGDEIIDKIPNDYSDINQNDLTSIFCSDRRIKLYRITR